MSFYDDLGVTPDATEDDIKRAYRKKASESHPDKGGSDEEMSKVNRAYEVLASPERRKIYDTIGSDASLSSDEELARSLVMNGFVEVINNKLEHGRLDAVRRFIGTKKQQSSAKNAEAMREKQAMLKLRGKIKVKDGTNLFHLVVDQRLIACERILAESQHDMTVQDLATEMLKGYESIEEAMQAQSATGGTGSTWVRFNPIFNP